MTAPILSVITPIKNGARYFQECLDSIDRVRTAGLALEHLVVDAASSDGSMEMIAPRDDTIVFDRPEMNSIAAMNFAIEQARGQFVTFLMSDDRFAPDFPALMQAFVTDYPECDLAVFGCELFGEGWSRVAGAPERIWHILSKYHGQNSMLVRRELFERIEIPLRYRLSNDRMMLLQLYRAARNLHVNRAVSASLRVHEGSQGNQIDRNNWEVTAEFVRMGHELVHWNESGPAGDMFAYYAWRRYGGMLADRGRLGPGPRCLAPVLKSLAHVPAGWALVKAGRDALKPRAGAPGYFDVPFDYVACGPEGPLASVTRADMQAGLGMKKSAA